MAALLAPRLPASAFALLVEHRRDNRADADVTLPLLMAARGAARGYEELPIVVTELLATRAMVERRALALLGSRPPALPALVEEELLISRGAPPVARDTAPAPPPGEARTQLPLV